MQIKFFLGKLLKILGADYASFLISEKLYIENRNKIAKNRQNSKMSTVPKIWKNLLFLNILNLLIRTYLNCMTMKNC